MSGTEKFCDPFGGSYLAMLMTICALLGAVLAQRCKLLVLVPAIGLVVLVTVTIGAREGGTFWRIFGAAAVDIAALQVGYLAGLVVHYIGNALSLASARRGSVHGSMSSRHPAS